MRRPAAKAPRRDGIRPSHPLERLPGEALGGRDGTALGVWRCHAAHFWHRPAAQRKPRKPREASGGSGPDSAMLSAPMANRTGARSRVVFLVALVATSFVLIPSSLADGDTDATKK